MSVYSSAFKQSYIYVRQYCIIRFSTKISFWRICIKQKKNHLLTFMTFHCIGKLLHTSPHPTHFLSYSTKYRTINILWLPEENLCHLHMRTTHQLLSSISFAHHSVQKKINIQREALLNISLNIYFILT